MCRHRRVRSLRTRRSLLMSPGILNIVGLEIRLLFLLRLQLQEAALFSAASKTLWNICPECRLLLHFCARQTRKLKALPYAHLRLVYLQTSVWHTIWAQVDAKRRQMKKRTGYKPQGRETAGQQEAGQSAGSVASTLSLLERGWTPAHPPPPPPSFPPPSSGIRYGGMSKRH